MGKIGRFYQAQCYRTPPHRINGARHQLMQDFLEKNGCQVAQGLVVPDRLSVARLIGSEAGAHFQF